MANRSASKPGRFIASHARSPFFEEYGLGVPGRIVGGQILRRRTAVGWRIVEIEIRRPWFLAAGHARAENHVTAVGREGEFLVAAVGLGRHIGIQCVAHVDRHAGATVGVHLCDEQVGACAVPPGVPVADEQAVIGARRDLPGRSGIEPIARALEIGAIREHVHAECDAPATRGKLETADVEWIVGDLHGLATRHRQAPDLHRTGARREEIDAGAIDRPARVHVIGRNAA